MQTMKLITRFALAASLALMAVVELRPVADARPVVALAARNAPMQWLIGDWICQGRYLDVPAFSVAHTVQADFHVAPSAGGAWITGHYQERVSSNGTLVAIEDNFAMDPFIADAGLRTFVDSNAGVFGDAYIVSGPQIQFSGTYTRVHQSRPLTETLVRSANDTIFDTKSRVTIDGVAIPFHQQRCVKSV
jgi:hypothetical protein